MHAIRSRACQFMVAAVMSAGSTVMFAAQPALPFDLKQLSIGLPEAGAPRAVVGPHAVAVEKPATAPVA